MANIYSVENFNTSDSRRFHGWENKNHEHAQEKYSLKQVRIVNDTSSKTYRSTESQKIFKLN